MEFGKKKSIPGELCSFRGVIFPCFSVFPMLLHGYLHIWYNSCFFLFFKFTCIGRTSWRFINKVGWVGHFTLNLGAYSDDVSVWFLWLYTALVIPQEVRVHLLVEAVVKLCWVLGCHVGQSSGPNVGSSKLSVSVFVRQCTLCCH